MFRIAFTRILQVPSMQMEANIFASIGAVSGSILTYMYGDGSDKMMAALFLVIIMDWITGLVASHKDGTYTSEYGIEGISRTLVILMLPAAGNLLDGILNTPGIIFYGVSFGLTYHILQSLIANSVRAKWDKWIPSTVIEMISDKIQDKNKRSEERKKEIEIFELQKKSSTTDALTSKKRNMKNKKSEKLESEE